MIDFEESPVCLQDTTASRTVDTGCGLDPLPCSPPEVSAGGVEQRLSDRHGLCREIWPQEVTSAYHPEFDLTNRLSDQHNSASWTCPTSVTHSREDITRHRPTLSNTCSVRVAAQNLDLTLGYTESVAIGYMDRPCKDKQNDKSPGCCTLDDFCCLCISQSTKSCIVCDNCGNSSLPCPTPVSTASSHTHTCSHRAQHSRTAMDVYHTATRLSDTSSTHTSLDTSPHTFPHTSPHASPRISLHSADGSPNSPIKYHTESSCPYPAVSQDHMHVHSYMPETNVYTQNLFDCPTQTTGRTHSARPPNLSCPPLYIALCAALVYMLLVSPPGIRCQTQLDQCADHQCANSAPCVDRGYDYTCNCSSSLSSSGFTGWYCNVSLSQSCSDGPCQNGGTCSDLTDSTSQSTFECACVGLYEGPLCEQMKDTCAENNYTLCQNGGTCINTGTGDGYVCQCDPERDYEGVNCEQVKDNCAGINCNNGRCQDEVNNYTCICEDGWQGAACDQAIDLCANGPLCQHGNCTDGRCECDQYFNGTGCDEDLDECQLSDPICLNGGNCTNKYEGFNCSCTLGYEGSRCEQPNCDDLCYSGSTCMTNATNWWCQCPEFVEGQLCDIFGQCFYQPCNDTYDNTAVCEQSIENDTYTCTCNTGWQGQNCSQDVDECTAADPSLRHRCVEGQGNCSNTPGSYECVCVAGYTGDFCQTDIDECDSDPCLHGGACEDLINDFDCNCNGTGYNGKRCETDINECEAVVPVCNHGNCSNDVPGYHCICGEQWLGAQCQFENPCYNVTCQNGGTCNQNVTDAAQRCSCADGYEGVTCEKSLASSGSSSDTDLLVIIGPIIGAVLFIIILIVVIAFIFSAKSKRATRGAYSPSAQENAGSRAELGTVLKKPPEERLI